MFRLLVVSCLIACTVAKPTIGHGLAVAAPISLNAGISQQSRVDIRTPVYAGVASPVYAAGPAVAAAPVALSSAYGSTGYGTGVGVGLGVAGYGVGVQGLGYGGYGLGH